MISKIVSVIDPSFQSTQVDKYSLSARVSNNRLDIAVLDSSVKNVVALESWNTDVGEDFASFAEAISKIKTGSSILGSGFNRVVILPDTPIFTLIPDELFIPEQAGKYLELNHSFDVHEKIKIDAIEKASLKNIYWIPYDVMKAADEIFLNPLFLHPSSILINTILSVESSDTVMAHFMGTRMDICVKKENKLKYCNSFLYTSAEDIIYFLLNVMQQLDIDKSDISLVIAGEMEKNSKAFEMINKYVKNISFAERPAGLKYCQGLQEIPGQMYYTLFNSFLCVS